MATIVIHGTLARNERWWRPGDPSGFLAALAQGMAAGGRNPHDVWAIGGRQVSQWDALRPASSWNWLTGRKPPPFDQIEGHFCWSGANVHSERLDGGRALAAYLEALAQIAPQERIDIVAHSHGANLVKVATSHIGRQVPLGALVFLAAPHCDKCQVSFSKVDYPYRLHLADGPAHRRVLNLFSAADPVQVKIAGLAPDSFGAAPGLPGISPLFDAYRVEVDPQAKAAYDNLEIAGSFGGKLAEHGALHNAAIGRLVGLWLARWPALSGADCHRHFAR